MKTSVRSLIYILFILLMTSCQHNLNEESILFVSFKDPGTTGIWYALSEDGMNFTGINKGQAVIPVNDSIQKMRDPFIIRDTEKGFHMVWTMGLRKIGYAWSPDLIDWNEQRIISIDADNDRVLNTWAPEIIYDQENKEWVIFYSSTIAGAFPETYGQVRKQKNHRIYAVKTRDFKSVSNPRLFFDPGYPVIDATILQEKNMYRMMFKDERDYPLRKQLKTAVSKSLWGPWKEVSDPLTESWTEGPSLISLDGRYLAYYDFYTDPRHMGLILSDDFKTWEDCTTQTSFPDRYKHGSFLEISRKELENLKKAFGPF